MHSGSSATVLRAIICLLVGLGAVVLVGVFGDRFARTKKPPEPSISGLEMQLRAALRQIRALDEQNVIEMGGEKFSELLVSHFQSGKLDLLRFWYISSNCLVAINPNRDDWRGNGDTNGVVLYIPVTIAIGPNSTWTVVTNANYLGMDLSGRIIWLDKTPSWQPIDLADGKVNSPRQPR